MVIGGIYGAEGYGGTWPGIVSIGYQGTVAVV